MSFFGSRQNTVERQLREHFQPESVSNLAITERQFPFRTRADLQKGIDRLFAEKARILHFFGVLQPFAHEGLSFSALIAATKHNPAIVVPPEYEEVDIGGSTPVRCLKIGLWLLEEDGRKFVVLLAPAGNYGRITGLKIQVATVNAKEGTQWTQTFFKRLEEAVYKSESYRGKVLSLETRESYAGMSSGILVHRLRSVQRDEVILPAKTLDLLDRNVVDFCRRRESLSKFGLSTKKGVLFYGPPGTGKTHTIHYLLGALQGHTAFLITAEQMGLLAEYMTLARLLQPSVVVIEDVDLIARNREAMGNACTESLLNVLLNEMDGLKEDADIMFLLTTNRPASLEAALASRPGRVDQAIEFPLPDEGGRERLIRLYSRGMSVPEELIQTTVKRTQGVSASFIRELMRRSAQFKLEKGQESGPLSAGDVDAALDELLHSGGALNRKLLGADSQDLKS